MTWQEIIGHDQIFHRFKKSFDRNRIASTYLFVGKNGIGKRSFALKLAQTVFCQKRSEDFQPCGTCPSCVQVSKRSHPDLILISKPKDKNFIPVEAFIGDREHRRRQGFCHDINLTPFSGDRKIAIIDDADFLNKESANSLLKTLEEPPPNSMIILIGTSEHRQLQTIISRSQVIRFQSLDNDQVVSILNKMDEQQLIGEIEIEKLAAAASGSISRAIELDNEELYSFRKQLCSQLASLDPAEGGFAKSVCEFVDGTSKESSVRRMTLRLLADFAVQLFSESLRTCCDLPNDGLANSDLNEYCVRLIENANHSFKSVEDILSDSIDRTVEFQQHVNANMATANIVPSWLNDLGAIARREKVFC